jgi:hypothetical protein
VQVRFAKLKGETQCSLMGSYKRQFHRARVAFPNLAERRSVTVCIAALFTWNYAGAPPQMGIGAVTASDRMITAADIQYEPLQQKIAFFDGTMILVAGDIAIHSQAILDAITQIRGRKLPPYDIAQIYGRSVQAINRRHAENQILGPLGLNTDTFLSQQKEFSDSFVNTITSQLQNYRPVDSEALVVGTDGERAHIYSVDAYGNDTNLDAVGFGAIGIGAWHAKSRLMQAGHVSARMIAPTLAALFAAKRNAEIAPGVGTYTDINIVLKGGISPLWDRVGPELHRLYRKYSQELDRISNEIVAELQGFIDRPQQSESDDPKGSPRENAQADASTGSDAAETPRGNETGKEGESGQESTK